MTQQLKKRLNESVGLRWLALLIVSLTMMAGYFVTDVMSPLQNLITTKGALISTTYQVPGTKEKQSESYPIDTLIKRVNTYNQSIGTPNYQPITEASIAINNHYVFPELVKEKGSDQKVEKVVDHTVVNKTPTLDWTNTDYGFFSGSYGYINVFLLMLFFGGLILDKMGVRFTGILSASLMLVGAFIKWWALSHSFTSSLFGMNTQVLLASLGFAIFGVGCEITGITVQKVIVKWFDGKEMAFAMGIQVALARLGTAAALGISPLIAIHFGGVSYSVLVGVIALLIGLMIYIPYCLMDVKEDNIIRALHTSKGHTESEDEFKFSDVLLIVKNNGFWLIALLCLMFYGAVFPFLKFATQLMIIKYHVPTEVAGFIPAVLPFGTIILTPIFGIVYDRIGKGATLMIIGSLMLTCVHLGFSLPMASWMYQLWFPLVLMIFLGIAFALVPSAMWPSVPKIIPMKQLGTAFSIIFYIQNIGLSLIPLFIGWVIDRFAVVKDSAGHVLRTNYSVPMYVFTIFGGVAIVIAILLYFENKRKCYGLQNANVKHNDVEEVAKEVLEINGHDHI